MVTVVEFHQVNKFESKYSNIFLTLKKLEIMVIPQLSPHYSRWRTSKVTYINEKLDWSANNISQSIELVTKCVLSNHKYDSENFQVSTLGFLTSVHLQISIDPGKIGLNN